MAQQVNCTKSTTGDINVTSNDIDFIKEVYAAHEQQLIHYQGKRAQHGAVAQKNNEVSHLFRLHQLLRQLLTQILTCR
jgi:hypothetical protein